MLALVSIPLQTMHVYRNGYPIGRAPVQICGRGPLCAMHPGISPL